MLCKCTPNSSADMFLASNPAQYIKKNVPKEQQMVLLNLLTECSDKVSSFPGMSGVCKILSVTLNVRARYVRFH